MNSVRAGACRAVFRRGGHIHSLHVMEREKQRDERVVGLMEVTVAAEERCRKRGRQWQAQRNELAVCGVQVKREACDVFLSSFARCFLKELLPESACIRLICRVFHVSIAYFFAREKLSMFRIELAVLHRRGHASTST